MNTQWEGFTVDPQVMGGRPCVLGTRVTVGTVVGLLAEGHSIEHVLELHPYVKSDDIRHCLAYVALSLQT